jgi:hypothetical protein
MGQALKPFRYRHCSRPDNGLARRYVAKVAGLSRAQVTRAIAQFVFQVLSTIAAKPETAANHRNGCSAKTVLADEVPCERHGSLVPRLIG